MFSNKIDRERKNGGQTAISNLNQLCQTMTGKTLFRPAPASPRTGDTPVRVLACSRGPHTRMGGLSPGGANGAGGVSRPSDPAAGLLFLTAGHKFD